MCMDGGVVTGPLIAMGVSAALSATTSAMSSAASAKAQNRQADYNSQVAQNNAEITRQERTYALSQASRNAGEKRKETAVIVGAQRARQGASGVVTGSGSTMDVVMNTAENGEREAVQLSQQGDVQAWRLENQTRGYEQQSALAESSKVSVGGMVAGALMSSVASSAMQMAPSLGGFSKAKTPATKKVDLAEVHVD